MRVTVSLGSLLVLCGAASLAGPIPSDGIEKSHPQIVRVSNSQGEVKLSTGKRGSPDLGKDWVAADVNLPIEEGATLATEEGRAEVEFENGSVAYLAEHSVLQFKGLKSNSQGTSTELALLTGRATFALESNGRDEITIDTASGYFHAKTAGTLRVESALDGTVFRTVEGSFQVPDDITGKMAPVGPGDAVQCVDGVLRRLESPQDDPDQKAWDQWVNEERTARKADIEKGLKESGLTAVIPGLVDLVREGTFTDCPPYGKCWEPQEGAYAESSPQEETAESKGQSGQTDSEAQTASGKTQSAQQSGKATSAVSQPDVRYEWQYTGVSFPSPSCPVIYARQMILMKYTRQNPKGIPVGVRDEWESQPLLSRSGWWATCHAGSWVPPTPEQVSPCEEVNRGNVRKCPPQRKKWVVGPKFGSGSFLRVRIGKEVGFIPKHPLDVKGKPPLNAKDGILTFREKGGQGVAEIKAAPATLRIEKNLPVGYEPKWAKNMPKVDKPVIEGKLMTSGTDSRGEVAPHTGNQKGQNDIRYDYKMKSFVGLANAAGGSRENERLVVIAHVGSSQENGSSSHAGDSGGKSERSGGSHTKTAGGEGSSRVSWQSSSHGSSGSDSSSRATSSGAGGSGTSQASSSGGGESRTGSQPSPAPTPSPIAGKIR